MTIEEAFTILNLEKNYTEEELKKRYRGLIKKYHPDYHMNESQTEIDEYKKKSQEINEAFNILKTNLKKEIELSKIKQVTFKKIQMRYGKKYLDNKENIDKMKKNLQITNHILKF